MSDDGTDRLARLPLQQRGSGARPWLEVRGAIAQAGLLTLNDT